MVTFWWPFSFVKHLQLFRSRRAINMNIDTIIARIQSEVRTPAIIRQEVAEFLSHLRQEVAANPGNENVWSLHKVMDDYNRDILRSYNRERLSPKRAAKLDITVAICAALLEELHEDHAQELAAWCYPDRSTMLYRTMTHLCDALQWLTGTVAKFAPK
jgi:hypothetical protein